MPPSDTPGMKAWKTTAFRTIHGERVRAIRSVTVESR
jgi:hypothetical protein